MQGDRSQLVHLVRRCRRLCAWPPVVFMTTGERPCAAPAAAGFLLLLGVDRRATEAGLLPDGMRLRHMLSSRSAR